MGARPDVAPRPRRRQRLPIGLLAAAAVLLLVLAALWVGDRLFLAPGPTAAPREACPSPRAPRGPDPAPADIALTVRNSTTTARLAAGAATAFAERGYEVLATGNAPDPLPVTEVHHGPGDEQSAEVVARELAGAVLVEDAALEDRVEVVLGTDYTGLRDPEAVEAAAVAAATSPSPTPSPCRSGVL